jgi:hypothetical protein
MLPPLSRRTNEEKEERERSKRKNSSGLWLLVAGLWPQRPSDETPDGSKM